MSLPINKNLDEDSRLTRIVQKEDILENMSDYQQAISFYRAYPDKLIDLYVEASGPDCHFKLYDYQRVLLRGLARNRHVFYTFSRGTSKSFIVVLWEFLSCILYPNFHWGNVALTKDQSAKIVEEKLSLINNFLPILNFEIKKIEKDKGSIRVIFKNNSSFENVAMKQSSRGLRFTGMVIEEICECTQDEMLEEVILPTLAIRRCCANGLYDPDDNLSQQEVYVTTAGNKNTIGYNKLIQCLVREVTEAGKGLVLGGSYRISVLSGLQTIDYIRTKKISGQLNPVSFGREYLSQWANGVESAYFNGNVFDKYRSIQEPVFEREANLKKNEEYIFGYDVARFNIGTGDNSELAVWKRIPMVGTTSMKQLVAIYTFENKSFPEQALEMKRLYYKYLPKIVVIDANGLGAGLVDELMQPTIDAQTNMVMPPWGVQNDDKGYYTQFRTPDMIPDIMYLIKANAQFNTQMYANYQIQLTTGKLRFLIDERNGKLKIDSSKAKKFKDMSDSDKADYIVQYVQTSLLKDQLLNLQQKNEGVNIILERVNSAIRKDKVSASGYGLWYIKTEIDDVEMRRKTMNINQFMNCAKSTSKKQTKITLTGGGSLDSLSHKYKGRK